MFTYSSQRTLFTTLTNNTSATNLTFADTFINQYTLELVHKFPSIFSEDTFFLQTYPNQQYYTLPQRMRKLNTVTINVGNQGSAVPTTVTGAGFNWPVKECPTTYDWNVLNMTNNITSDIPLAYLFYDNQLGIYPKPAGGYNPITIRGQVEVASITQVDDINTLVVSVPYALILTAPPVAGATSATLTTNFLLPTNTYQMVFSDGETILVTLTNGSTAVTWTEALANTVTTAVSVRTSAGGDILTTSGTALAASMVGYVLQIAQPTGDGQWYTIGTFYNSTTIALTNAYGGSAIVAGSVATIIGQTSIIPPAYQLIPIYRACQRYYTVIKNDPKLRDQYKQDAEELTAQMEIDYGDKNTDPTVNDNFDLSIVNPNLAINTTQSTGL